MSHVDQTNRLDAEQFPADATDLQADVVTDHNHKLYIETVGCQMNMLDSELVVADLRKRGYELTRDVKEAETILFNTCSVREHAEHKIYSSLGRLRYGARKNPKKVIGVMGCMAQKDQNLIFQKAPQVDFVVGTGQLAQVAGLIDKARINHHNHVRSRELAVGLGRKDGKHTEITNSFQSYDPLRDPEMRPSPYQAFVRIMIGCDKFCSYCVVPSTRGPEQSRSPREILSEVKVLSDQGVKEVTLLGQTVNSYKHTQDGKLFRLSDLLHLIHEVEGIDRIKFVTSYPKDMTNDLLEAIRDLPKATRYLHVPLQHGCNDVLKVMKRGYTVEDYRDMMQRINEILPGCSVSSDFIVGHPGETEESHQKSLASIREFRFKNSFIFKYSERPGTKAAERFPDEIPDEVKKRRNNEMLKVQNEISEEDNAEFIGRQVEVLVEGPSKSAQKVGQDSSGALAEQLVGRSNCDRIVVFDGNPRLAGTIARIEIIDVTPTTLIGSIVTKEYQLHSGPSLPILQ
ncbi:MAG: tRNA (N6-isopentenyl adenosine(37)-C2)-methylthiotransferase MiaB [Planctomycetota bacterium]|uniref:tRNA (N6-isopentenyl adenosine(37)-C2)-methylthiotransferase MiaB n=1 Tax=uncultured Gimesia sp. TaxID=1678688 RepID=UPI002639BFED|nr:tRNA (N6-isopentenyl adenosine(37)-C2)-methylthiotransferase MiaB [uncultured Gimesia sp.]